MKNLRRKYNATNTDRYLEAGIIENCVIRSVDINVRKKADGSYINMLMFIKVSQLDDDGNLFAESEFGLNKVTDDNPSWISYTDNVMRNVNQLAEILEQVYSEEDVDQYFDPFSAIGVKEEEDIEKLMKGKPKVVEEFNKAMKEQFSEMMEDIVGLESDYKFRIKLTYDSKGRYLQLPQRDFIEPMTVSLEDTRLEITDLDLARKAEHAKQLTASKDSSTPKGTPPVPGKKPPVPGAKPKVPGAPGVKPSTNPVKDKAEENGSGEESDALGDVPGEEAGVKPPPFKKKLVKKTA